MRYTAQLRAAAPPDENACAAALREVHATQQRLASTRRLEIGLVLGSAAVSLAGFVLSEAGYRKAAGALTIGSIIVGAALGAAKLVAEDVG